MYKLTNTEITRLLKENLKILFDTRETVNGLILEYFDKENISYKRQKLDVGDYTAIITVRPEIGIYRDLAFKVGVIRKTSIDEIAENLIEKRDYREEMKLERQLMRGKVNGIKMSMIIEDPDGLENIRNGIYRSSLNPKAFMGKFSSLQDKYIQNTVFTSNENTGYHIHRILYYSVRNFLKEI